MRDPDFTDQVYELAEMARSFKDPRSPFRPAPVETEVVWLLPRGTAAAIGATPPGPLTQLLGMPAEEGDVDRPVLIIRPVKRPEPGPFLIGRAIDKVMRDYDRGADPYLGL
jgi:hypothetical protein